MRCQTVTNYQLRSNQKWIDLLHSHGFDQNQIFRVDCLSDRLFSLGFRIVNPEFNDYDSRIRSDLETLGDILQDWDSLDYDAFHNYKTNASFTPKQRAIHRSTTGEDR